MTPTRPPRVTTITVGTNERPWLDTCFASLLGSDTDGIDLSVMYVDNASHDGSADHVRSEFPEITVIPNRHNYGFARANNIGMRHALAAGADYVFLVNPDTRSPSGLVRGLVQFMQRWPDYGIVGPMQYRFHESSADLNEYNDWSTLALQTGERHAFAADWPDHPSPASPMEGRAPNTLEHPYVQGSALFARAEALRTVGIFDEVFHTYYEEVDLCRRARWAGWRVALTLDLGIQHKGGGGAGRGRYRRVNMRRNRYYYLLTDVEWAPADAARLAARWLRRDLLGNSVGGRTTPLIGAVETVGAAGWLAVRAPQVLARRRQYRQLRLATARREGTVTAAPPDAAGWEETGR
ncbi:glycosyltransferase family 2 protein [Micromonospora sp. NPDC050980]|uniref:glycosyltransferase family 2 protein n=1 Tax=Micromonospora sp. NPDC050980 TaxID=3155161 RepID=UPI0033D6C121